jgi:hypothetical protein
MLLLKLTRASLRLKPTYYRARESNSEGDCRAGTLSSPIRKEVSGPIGIPPVCLSWVSLIQRSRRLPSSLNFLSDLDALFACSAHGMLCV